MADLTIINAALTRTGNDPITRLNDGSPGGTIASQNYELLVKAELANYPWKRASKTVELARLDPDVEGEPPEPWQAAYELPTDLVEIRSVRVGGLPINYAVQGETILCDAAESSSVVLEYVWRETEARWPAWFRLGMIYRCEAMFLRGIGERYAEAKDADKRADDQFAKARNRDSQSQPNRNPVTSPLLAARIGSVNASANPFDR